MPKRIVFTGGTGKAGRHAIPHLLAKGHKILNVDRMPLAVDGVYTLLADITDSGQCFNALTAHFGFGGFEAGQPPSPPDAVVHFAAIPRVLIEPDNVTYQQNVIGTYNVIEAAMKLGVRKVIIASQRDDLWRVLCRRRQGLPRLPAGGGLRHRSDGQLRPVQGGEREDRPRLRHALWRRHLRPADRQCHRAARI